MSVKRVFLVVVGLLLSVNAQAEMVGPPSVPIVPLSDADGIYRISWSRSATPRASYVLEEATAPDFSANLRTAYAGRSTHARLRGRYAGSAYYYRLKATLSGYEDSAWQPGNNGCTVPYVVDAKANAGGVIWPSGKVTVPVGASQEFTITPDVGFHTDSVLVDGVEHGAIARVTAPADLVPNAKNKHAIKVKFAINRYEVTAEAGAGGKITPAGVRLYRHGKKATYTIKPDRGYRIASVQVNGEEAAGLPACGTFKQSLLVTGTTRITATFIRGCTDGTPDPGPATWHWRNPLPQGNALIAVTYGDGLYVAVGGDGVILTSPDGAAWTGQASGVTRTLNAVTYGNGLFVAVGNDGMLLTSLDGAFWMPHPLGTTGNLLGVAYGNGRFVAVGDGVVATSFDGVNWTATPSEHIFINTAFGNDRFVAVFATPPGSPDVATSIDGITWSVYASGTHPDRDLFRVFYGNGLFVALAGSGNILTSADGAVWTHRSGDKVEWLYSVAYGNGLFLAVGGSGQSVVSADGITWVERASNSVINPLGMVFADGRFLAVDGWSRIATTMDGDNWTAISSAVTDRHLRKLTYGGGQFVAVGDHGTIVTSPDGVAWTARVSGTDVALGGVAWGNGIYVAVGENSTYLTSPDGVIWTVQPPSTIMAHLTEVTFGNGVFIAAGGLYDYTLINYISPDGVNWTVGSGDNHTFTFAEGRFLAWETHLSVHGYFPTYNAAVSSTDGLSWTTVSTSQNLGLVKAMTRGDRLYAAIGGGCPQGQCVTTSPDGANWTDHPVWTVDALSGIAYGGGSYVAVGNNGTIAVSGNGADWRVRKLPVPYYLYDVAYGNNTFVAVGASGVILQSEFLSGLP